MITENAFLTVIPWGNGNGGGKSASLVTEWLASAIQNKTMENGRERLADATVKVRSGEMTVEEITQVCREVDQQTREFRAALRTARKLVKAAEKC